MASLRSMLRLPLRTLFSNEVILRRVAFEIRQNHFDALKISIPLSHDFACPISRIADFFSFSEMFILGEYGDFLDHMALPRRWLDLGCHVGYFSLYLAWQHAVRGGGREYQGLLVDADRGVTEQARRTLSENQLSERFIVRHGAIAEGATKVTFWLQPIMGSSMLPASSSGAQQVAVPVISAEEILAELPPPYDLVKLDIEGAETDFLQAYGAVLKESRYVLLEWHTWNGHRWDEAAISRRMQEQGFVLMRKLRPATSFKLEEVVFYSGVDLYRSLR